LLTLEPRRKKRNQLGEKDFDQFVYDEKEDKLASATFEQKVEDIPKDPHEQFFHFSVLRQPSQ
jgi:hypothetical protein